MGSNVDRPLRLIAPMHDNVDAPLAEPAKESCPQAQLAIEQLVGRCTRLDVQVDVAAPLIVVDARAEQAHDGVVAEDVPHRFDDGSMLLGSQSHGDGQPLLITRQPRAE